MAKKSQSLQSSALAGVDYDTDTKTLTVTFRNGQSYPLANVPDEIYDQLISSPSPGRFWHEVLQAFT